MSRGDIIHYEDVATESMILTQSDLTHIAGFWPITVKIFIFSMFFRGMIRRGGTVQVRITRIRASFGL
jgi:hypothetical protein